MQNITIAVNIYIIPMKTITLIQFIISSFLISLTTTPLYNHSLPVFFDSGSVIYSRVSD